MKTSYIMSISKILTDLFSQNKEGKQKIILQEFFAVF